MKEIAASGTTKTSDKTSRIMISLLLSGVFARFVKGPSSFMPILSYVKKWSTNSFKDSSPSIHTIRKR